ncbi:ABC transporter ATP-binding protein [Candidatus Bipolaricaulota bacterium]|nr:ABC transporter ATP-binding protein [Candidatus Bipolaricaulota bacterium]
MTTVVEISGARKVYSDGTVALKGIDLDLNKGQILGLIGPNGAGKTTLVELVLGLLKPTSGNCRLWGDECYTLSPSLKRKVGFLLEGTGLYDNLTVRENLSFWAQTYETEESDIERILADWDLQQKVDNPVKQLSAGMKQKLAISRALLPDPPLIILDEPTSNLDPEARKGVVELLQSYAGEKTLLITSHDLFDIERICETIILLRQGEINARGTMDKLREDLGAGREIEIEVEQNFSKQARTELLDRFGGEFKGEETFVLSDEDTKVGKVVGFLARKGLDVKRVEEEKLTLEDVYTSIINEDEDDGRG